MVAGITCERIVSSQCPRTILCRVQVSPVVGCRQEACGPDGENCYNTVDLQVPVYDRFAVPMAGAALSEVKVVLVKPVGPAPVALRKKLRLMIWLFGAPVPWQRRLPRYGSC